MMIKRNPRSQQQRRDDAPIGGGAYLPVYDGEYKNLFKVPMELIVHTPPPQMHITRLVLCRNYMPGNPDSCPVGDRCKFVHAECFAADLTETTSVHVKYCWHHQDDCTYPRLPAGETLCVSAPNNRMPFDNIPSDCVLATRGALNRHTHGGQLSHCAHYLFSKTCKRGADCHFIHAVIVDPTAVAPGHFCRASHSKNRKTVPLAAPTMPDFIPPPPVVVPQPTAAPATFSKVHGHALVAPSSEKGMSTMMMTMMMPVEESFPAQLKDKEASSPSSQATAAPPRLYRHNPYSTQTSTVYLLG